LYSSRGNANEKKKMFNNALFDYEEAISLAVSVNSASDSSLNRILFNAYISSAGIYFSRHDYNKTIDNLLDGLKYSPDSEKILS
jgi:hypothetical protein